MLFVQGVDVSKVKYVEAGWPTWATALKAGQGDAALSWEGLRAEWIGKGLEFEYWLGVQKSPLFANTFIVRAADLNDPDKKAFLEKYLRGWAMGLEFGYLNPRAAVEAVFEQFPTLASNLGPKLGTTSCLQQTNVFRGDMAKRTGWGDHNMDAWQLFFDKIYELKQITKPVRADDVCTNVLIAGAQQFRPREGEGRRRRLQAHEALRRSRRRRHKSASFRSGDSGQSLTARGGRKRPLQA